MKTLLYTVLLLVGLSANSGGEDYRCGEDAGCTAQIVEDGVIEEVAFRKGDLVSTEDGWIVSTDDGWVKVKKPVNCLRRTLGFLWLGEDQHLELGPVSSWGRMGIVGGWRRPMPPLIGLL